MLKRILSAVTALAIVTGAGNFASSIPNSSASYSGTSQAYTCGDVTYEVYVDSHTREPAFLEIAECSKSAEGEIVIPEEIEGLPVQDVGDFAFKGCTGLTSIILCNNIRYIGKNAFEGCTGLKSITMPDRSDPQYEYTSFQIENYAFKDCTSLTSITIPDRLWQFNDGVFSGCSSLLSITIPEKIQVIGNSAFNGCTSLTSATLSSNTVNIGTNAFANCTSLASIELPDGLKKIGARAFSNCSSLTSITIPDTVSNIEMFAFKDCSELTSINIPEEITEIKQGMFSGCSSLTSIKLSESITSIEKDSFKNSGLTSIEFPEGCEYLTIGDSAFEKTDIEELTLNYKTDIGKNAFAGCGSLMSVELNDSNVSTGAFSKCSSLREIIFSGTTVLDTHSVIYCPVLENIDFSDCKLTSDYSVTKCPMLVNLDSFPAFDSDTGDFTADKKDFILEHFNGADDVGFMNQFVNAQVDKIVSEYITEDMSDLQRVIAMHDWVCENTKYTEGNTKDHENHNDASVFINEYTVCEGYARACNLLYNAAGIETYYVQSPNHAWNIVNVDGHFFHVDATWDDGDTISRNWFLKSDEELKAAGGSHAEWELFVPSSLHSFQKNTLPECSYRMGDVNFDGIIDSSDASDVLQAYADLSTNQASDIDRILADYNLDGIIDSTDASDILAVYAYNSTT